MCKHGFSIPVEVMVGIWWWPWLWYDEWMDVYSFTVTHFLRHTTAPFPCRRGVEKLREEIRQFLKLFAFSQERNSLFFVCSFGNCTTTPIGDSVGARWAAATFKHRVCVFIPSQASWPGLPAPASSQFHYAQERTHMPAVQAGAAWRGAHGEARWLRRIAPLEAAPGFTSHICGRSVPALPRGWGAAAFTSLSLLPHLCADGGGVRTRP